MNVESLVRDAKAIKSNLVTLADKRVITKEGCVIHIPTRYIDRELANVGVTSSTLGILAIVDFKGRYSVLRIPSRLNISPSSISRVMIDNTDYTLFRFEPGTVVFTSTMCVKVDTLTYYVFDELFLKGKVPWFIDYNDLGMIFTSSEEYAGTKVAANRIVIEMITSHVGRVRGDKTKFFRHAVKTLQEASGRGVEFISLNNVSYSPSSTMYKLAGSYMDEGLVSAFNNPSENIDRVEAIVRA
jgi:hypothetical protein